jgi:hypothetical protein
MAKEDLIYQVKSMLSIFPDARNSDITLTIKLWENFYPSMIHNSERLGEVVRIIDLFDLPREDNIKRIRAKIQNEERLYLPTDIKVFVERARASDEWRKFLGYRIHKLPEVMTDADIEMAIEEYLSTPTQTKLL